MHPALLRVSGSTTVFTGPGMGFALSGWVRSSSTGWTAAGAASIGVRNGTSVTIVLLGTSAAGRISATTCFASCFEQWKNLGITSARFSLVITFASWMTLVMQSRPSRTGSTTSGNLPDEPGRDLPVVGRTAGEADLPVEKIEEARESEMSVHGQPVELGEGEEEIGEGAALPSGEIGDAEGPFACVHGSTFAREISPSPDA